MADRIVFYPFKMGSATCKLLAQALSSKYHGKIIRVHPDRRFHPKHGDTIINWGRTPTPRWGFPAEGLNKPEAVHLSVNKLRTFQRLTDLGLSTVPWTTLRSEAEEWPIVVERHVLEGYGGAGITINTGEEVGDAPLYTKLLKPSNEYRVHVFNGEVIDYTKKYKRIEGEVKSRVEGDYVKNRENGWEYVRDVEPRESVKDLAIAAIEGLGLDFGAVDIIRHKKKNYVLEVGTAPGLSPRGIEAYSDAIIQSI